jgi:hypothetical protein
MGTQCAFVIGGASQEAKADAPNTLSLPATATQVASPFARRTTTRQPFGLGKFLFGASMTVFAAFCDRPPAFGRRPLSGVTRNTFAQIEFFRV